MMIMTLAGTSNAQWVRQASGTKARLRGLSVVSEHVAWASGSSGTCLRTSDGGTTWKARPVPGAADLDFRDVHAVDAEVAYLLSIGPGDRSRIYKTRDGGATWTRQFTNPDAMGFFDAIAFWDADHGLIFGDPVDGRFVIFRTDDGGAHWHRPSTDPMPPALAGEGAFAASGTCLVVQGTRKAWFATGGAKVSRVFRSVDRGATWTAHETAVAAGSPSAGIFSLAFHDDAHGIAVGGDYKNPAAPGTRAALTSDGGKTWTPTSERQPAGYRSCVAFLAGNSRSTLIAVGPDGADQSHDGGRHWTPFGTSGFDTLAFAPGAASGWAAGDAGSIARVQVGTVNAK
jgi:photosystem II stability/assembly factor-like uncharacterized protein